MLDTFLPQAQGQNDMLPLTQLNSTHFNEAYLALKFNNFLNNSNFNNIFQMKKNVITSFFNISTLKQLKFINVNSLKVV